MRTLLLLFLLVFLVGTPAWAQDAPAIVQMETAHMEPSMVAVVVDAGVPLPGASSEPLVVTPSGFKDDAYSDPLNLLDLFEKAVTTRNYMMGAGVLLLVAMWLVRRKWSSIPPDLLPAVSLVLASMPALALTFMRPGVDLAMVWKQVVIIALMSGGAWSAIGKHIFGIVIPKLVELLKKALTWLRTFWTSTAPPTPPAPPAGPVDPLQK